MKLPAAMPAALLLATLLSALPAYAGKPPIGEPPPNFTLASDGPFNLRLSEQKGYIVVAGFWASWCRSCPEQLQALNQLHQKYADMGVKVWGISLDRKRDDMLRQKNKYHLQFTQLQDSDTQVSERYDLDEIPAIIVVDRDGKLRLMTEGFNRGDEARLDQLLQTLVNE